MRKRYNIESHSEIINIFLGLVRKNVINNNRFWTIKRD